MKKKDIVILWRVMQELQQGNDKLSIKLLYAIDRNNKIVNDEIESLKLIDVSSVETEFEQKRVELINKYATKGEDGNLLVEENHYVFYDENKDKFEEEFKILQDEYTPIIQEKGKVWNETLEEDVDLDLYKIDIKFLPEELTPSQYNAFKLIIKEGE